MLNLLCINNSPIIHKSGVISEGAGLLEGAIYTTEDKIYIHPNNKKPCYYIFELFDLKLVSRFIPISDLDETELINFEENKKLIAITNSPEVSIA